MGLILPLQTVTRGRSRDVEVPHVCINTQTSTEQPFTRLEMGVAFIKPEPGGADELPGTFLFSILLQGKKNPIK